MDIIKEYLYPGVKTRVVKGSSVQKSSRSFSSLPVKSNKLPQKEFFKLIESLEEVVDRSEALLDAGVDFYEFESLYLDSIEILMLKLFNKPALNLIHIYLYGVPYDFDYSIPLELLHNLPEFKTVDELWTAVKKLEHKKK